MFRSSLLSLSWVFRSLPRATALATLTLVPMFAALPLPETVSAPPSYPDTAHVANGCHLSTLAFLARFHRDFPEERGEPLIILMDNIDGVTRPHTLAVLTWRGAWWARDEYFGVFPLRTNTAAVTEPARLKSRAAVALAKAGRARRDTLGYRRAPVLPGSLDSATLAREATAATEIVPFPSTLFWMSVGTTEIPLVFFRPAPDWIAVYDPHRGTSLAECSNRDDAAVVRLVAKRLGYRAVGLRAEEPGYPAPALARAN